MDLHVARVVANALRLRGLFSVFILLGMLFLRPQGARAFNLATNKNCMREYKAPGQTGIRFGYSVALWTDLKGRKSVVVSAPMAGNVIGGDVNVSLPLGALYLCNLEGDCKLSHELPRITKPRELVALTEGTQVANMGVGFGETLFTNAQIPSKLVSCAPRFVVFLKKKKASPNSTPALESRGTCYVFNQDDDKPLRLETFLKKNHGKINDIGYALGGTSAVLNQNSSSIYMGAPGAYNGQGGIWQTHLANGTFKRSKHSSTNRLQDSTYETWAMVKGRFLGQNNSEMLAVSVPNLHNQKGEVRFYHNLIKNSSLKGSRVSAMFGYALAAGDFDGDGIHDIAVGTPLAGVERRVPDGGSVFVYYRPVIQQDKIEELQGHHAYGRFGMSLLAQDLDSDEHSDLLVGAPYEDNGAVYVFYGSEYGLVAEPSQIIRASDFVFGHRGFGFSLGGGTDVDDNGHLDVVVGAWSSDSAVLIRSSPVVYLEGQVVMPQTLLLDDRSCKISAPGSKEDNVVCFNVTLKMAYRSQNYTGNIRMFFHITLESNQLSFQHDPYKRSIEKHVWITQSFVNDVTSLYVKPNRESVGDILSLRVNASLPKMEECSEVNKKLAPVMDMRGQTSFQEKVRVICNNSDSCFPKSDLKVEATAEPFTVGSKLLVVNVYIETREAPAYQVALSMKFSNHLLYAYTQGSIFPSCNKKESTDDNAEQDCHIKDFLPVKYKVSLQIYFSYNQIAILNEDDLHFTFQVRSDNYKTDSGNHISQLKVPIETKLDVDASGLSTKEVIRVVTNSTVGLGPFLNISERANGSLTPEQVGPSFKHVYSLLNQGPSPILTAEVTIALPYRINDQRQLLYLAESPETKGPMRCNSPPINSLNLTLTGFDSDRDNENDDSVIPVYARNDPDDEPDNITSSTLFTTSIPSRKKRSSYNEIEAYIEEEKTSKKKTRPENIVDCDEYKCPEIKCMIEGLNAGMETSVAVPILFVVASILELDVEIQELTIASKMKVIVTSPKISNPPHPVTVEAHASTVFTLIYPPKDASIFSVPWWWWVLAAVLGLLLLLIIAFSFYKLNFFKRNRPPQGYASEGVSDAEDIAYHSAKDDPPCTRQSLTPEEEEGDDVHSDWK
ncbi:integrin alpha-IIb-like isoform X2 [Oratosquilla oratoria]|uniref:integrin alpha-IIb-like isoform X2 n=1 Tax=Oratosquilla oratoria TaxID=337810 RepID=UPI003F7769FC